MTGQSSLDRVLLISLFGVATALVVSGCTGSKDCGCGPGLDGTLYSCSFEADADTLGWTGYGSIWLADDAPPGGGSRALGVEGGCIAPHAAFTLEPEVDGSYCSIWCWAREVSAPGRVELRLAADYEGGSIDLIVQGTDWKRYSASGFIWCPAGRSLEINVYSGGFRQPGGILLDLLEVVRVQR
ncbi:MAG: hypothetical protein ABIJ00_00020 [Candidatus Eisenbacteria bacterium]